MKFVTTIRDLAIKAGRAFVRLAGWLLSPIFGKLSWNAPPWANWTGAKAAAVGRAAVANPQRTGLVLVLLVALLAGGFYGYRWWQSRP